MGVLGVPGSEEAMKPANTDISLSPTIFVATILNWYCKPAVSPDTV